MHKRELKADLHSIQLLRLSSAYILENARWSLAADQSNGPADPLAAIQGKTDFLLTGGVRHFDHLYEKRSEGALVVQQRSILSAGAQLKLQFHCCPFGPILWLIILPPVIRADAGQDYKNGQVAQPREIDKEIIQEVGRSSLR